MSEKALNIDLQQQAPSAQETESGNAIVTVYEIYLENSDLGGAGTDKLYFHDGTEAPADSYGSLQMYSPTSESNWGSTTSSDYSLKTYTPFPFEFNGYDRKAKGPIPRPTVRFANINRDFTVYNTTHDDLLGAKIIRRKTLVKYLGENPPVEFPREIYYIDRLASETQNIVEYELTTNFDIQGVLLPSRRIIATRCPWKYKDSTVGGCDWPADSTHDYTSVTGGSITDQKVYVDVDDNYITAGSHGATTYSVWANSTSYTKDYFTEYFIPLSTDYTVSAAARVDSTHVKYTTAGTSLGFSVNDYINVRGSAVDDWDFGEMHLKLSAVAESGGNTELTAITTESSGFDSYTSGGLISKTRNTLYKCIKAHTSSTSKLPGTAGGKDYWEVGDVCGKRLISCKKRFGFIKDSGTIEALTIAVINGTVVSGSGYSSAPTITIADPPSGTTATATCTISGGSINNITLTNAGSGYTSTPAVTVSAPSSGTTARIRATVRGEYIDSPLPFGGFPGAVTYS